MQIAAIDGTAVLTMVEFELLHEKRHGDDPWQEALDRRTIHSSRLSKISRVADGGPVHRKVYHCKIGGRLRRAPFRQAARLSGES